MHRLIAVLLAACALVAAAGCSGVPLADDEEAWSQHTPRANPLKAPSAS